MSASTCIDLMTFVMATSELPNSVVFCLLTSTYSLMNSLSICSRFSQASSFVVLSEASSCIAFAIYSSLTTSRIKETTHSVGDPLL